MASNGSTTTEKSLGAFCYVDPSAEIFCGNNIVPIGTPLGAPASFFSAARASEEAGEGMWVTKAFSIDNETLQVKWSNPAFENGVRFVYKMDGSQSVWAVFGGVLTTDSVGAELVGVSDWGTCDFKRKEFGGGIQTLFYF